jgi:regulator of sigma E protease
MSEFLYLLAFLSMQLGVMNLLPIPVLDGGHIFFMLIEMVRRKPITPRIRHVSMQLGTFVLLALMLVVTFNDVDNVWGFANIFQKIKGIF